MKLTGKSLEQFEDWFRNSELIIEFTFLKWIKNKNIGIQFYSLPLSMQYGVLVDFFDSVGIDLRVDRIFMDDGWFCCIVNKVFIDTDNGLPINHFATRPQARAKAIEKANNLFNSRI